MAAQPDPKVKKTKKMSYKPLSQLNEDRLNELQRIDRPENAARVFYYGLAHEARLRQNVNVWFRDHRHCLSLLQRQQRAVQHQMGRLQHDVRRVRREEYKRRQEEIRTKLTRLQKKEMNTEAKTDTVSETEPSPEQGVFSHVPSRAKVMEDVGMMLGEEEEEEEEGLLWKGGRQGVKGLPSLAARIRQQRKREAKRRSQLLDREPMVQYYRSVRGTLEPLLSEPTRKSFPFPSGRAQYEQNKMLREELQKDVGRKQEIDNFFNNLFNRQTAQETTKAAAKMGPMNALLQMRQKGQASRRTSIQQLAACQYLHLHDWEAKNRKDQDKEPVASSWANAEKGLKAGFLALDFTGNR